MNYACNYMQFLFIVLLISINFSCNQSSTSSTPEEKNTGNEISPSDSNIQKSNLSITLPLEPFEVNFKNVSNVQMQGTCDVSDTEIVISVNTKNISTVVCEDHLWSASINFEQFEDGNLDVTVNSLDHSKKVTFTKNTKVSNNEVTLPMSCATSGSHQIISSINPIDTSSGANYIFNEISGVAISKKQTHNGNAIVWVHNDSGGGAKLAAYDSATGERLKSIRLTQAGVDATDWEDIDVAPCGDSTNDCVYIGNFGNNAARTNSPYGTQGRTELAIYKFIEPDVNSISDNFAISSGVKIIKYKYSGANNPTTTSDAEAMFVDPTGDSKGGKAGDIYILTKWNNDQASNTRLFKIPLTSQNTSSAILAEAILSTPSILKSSFVRADLSNDGHHIIAGTYSNVYLWTRQFNQTIAEALTQNACKNFTTASGDTESQFEAIAINSDGSYYFEISECNVNKTTCKPKLHKTVLK